MCIFGDSKAGVKNVHFHSKRHVEGVHLYKKKYKFLTCVFHYPKALVNERAFSCNITR